MFEMIQIFRCIYIDLKQFEVSDPISDFPCLSLLLIVALTALYLIKKLALVNKDLLLTDYEFLCVYNKF